MKECMIYGAGLSGAVAQLVLEGTYGYKCINFIDDSQSKQGTYFNDIKVIAMEDALELCKEGNIEILVSSEQYWFEMERKLIDSGFQNYRIFHYATYIDDGKQINYGFIDPSLAREAETLFEDEYSKLIYKNILEHKKLNKSYYVNLHDQYFLHYAIKGDDIVFDCGAAYGWFTQRVLSHLKTGRVFAFEPDPVLFSRLESQYKDNKAVVTVNAGVFSERSAVRFNTTLGSGCNKIDGCGDALINVVDIDTFVKENKIEKVDFIKMDIEGAELDAVIGAQDTIRLFKPALAICVYHKREDIWNIPIKIKETRKDYKLFLDQHGIWMGETVLYAV
jgi:FkbM family methyltransferase